MNVLTIALAFIKAHLSTILLVLVICCALGALQHQRSNFANDVKKLNDSHQTEIDQITHNKAIEEQQHADEVKELHDSLAKIQSNFADVSAQVVVHQSQEQSAIVKKYGNDMDGLADLTASKFPGLAVQKEAK